MSKKLRACRCCGKLFRDNVRELQGCCTHLCFNKAGGYPVVEKAVITITRPPNRKTRKERQEARAAAKSKSKAFYESREWLEIRYDVLKKYGRVCALCRSQKGQMHVDHIVPKSVNPGLALNFDNLQVLCKACNLGKSNRDSTDFREK